MSLTEVLTGKKLPKLTSRRVNGFTPTQLTNHLDDDDEAEILTVAIFSYRTTSLVATGPRVRFTAL
jgi:hypothetical protein